MLVPTHEESASHRSQRRQDGCYLNQDPQCHVNHFSFIHAVHRLRGWGSETEAKPQLRAEGLIGGRKWKHPQGVGELLLL